MKFLFRCIVCALVLPGALVVATAVQAHVTGDAAGGSFVTGFEHPLAGLDHVLAMLAVGMWGAQLGTPAIWVLPVAFPMVMALGGMVGIVGVPLPAVETGIVLSVVMLGGVIALDRRPPLPLAALLVGFFAVFHGYAHGVELPGHAGALPYCAGFVIATGLIHITGILIGLVTHAPKGLYVLRIGGGAIALTGVYLAWQLLST
jgi:urease accessory protein